MNGGPEGGERELVGDGSTSGRGSEHSGRRPVVEAGGSPCWLDRLVHLGNTLLGSHSRASCSGFSLPSSASRIAAMGVKYSRADDVPRRTL